MTTDTAPSGTLVPFVLFCGPAGPGQAEAMVDGARRAAALDLLAVAARTGVLHPLLVVMSDADETLPLPAGVETVALPPSPAFHVGRALRGIVRARGFQRVLFAGAGAGVLMRADDLLALAGPLQGPGPAVVANNLHSADVAGVTPASALNEVDLPAEDNGIPYVLWRRERLPGHEPPRTPATQFDLDSPTDLLVAAAHPGLGPHLRAYVQALNMGPSTGSGQAPSASSLRPPLRGVHPEERRAQGYGSGQVGQAPSTGSSWQVGVSRLRAAAAVFRDPLGQVLVAGRVGSATWSYLERETACRVRLVAEERGMRALGLEGQARSLLGLHLEAVGPQAFMAHLAELGDAAFIDTRVILAHRRSTASREDRFLSDLGRWDEIADPFLRELTAAAVEAPIPVVLGGHTLVSGGLMALVEAAWEDTGEEAGGER